MQDASCKTSSQHDCRLSRQHLPRVCDREPAHGARTPHTHSMTHSRGLDCSLFDHTLFPPYPLTIPPSTPSAPRLPPIQARTSESPYPHILYPPHCTTSLHATRTCKEHAHGPGVDSFLPHAAGKLVSISVSPHKRCHHLALYISACMLAPHAPY